MIIYIMAEDQSFNIKFLKAVESFPEIYNYKLDDYSNKMKVEQAWKEIGAMFNKTGEACMDKWRVLRGSYVRYNNRSKFAGIKREYYLAKYMTFLLPYIKSKVQIIKKRNKIIKNPITNMRREHPNSDNDDDDDEESNEIDVGTESTTFHNTSEENKRTINNWNTTLLDLVNSRKKFKSSEENNADLHFFKSILPDVASLSSKHKNIFKGKILSLLNDLIDDQNNSGSLDPLSTNFKNS